MTNVKTAPVKPLAVDLPAEIYAVFFCPKCRLQVDPRAEVCPNCKQEFKW